MIDHILPSDRRRAPGFWLALLLAVLLVSAACAPGTTATPTTGQSAGQAATVAVPAAATDLQGTVENVIRVVQPSVVEIQSTGASGSAIGSGEVMRGDGYIVTNDHVVRGGAQWQVVLANGQTVPARLVGEAPADDLAVLKVDATGLRPINFGDSSTVKVGQFVIALGSPLGLTQSATLGIISALNRTASEAPEGPAGTLTGLIQTSAPINPGNSGGALVGLTGQLVGVPTLAAANPQAGGAANGIGFAIASNRVKFIADQLIQYGEVKSTGQGFLGIVGTDVTPELAQAYNLPVDHGVLITRFTNAANGQSPAERAGLRQGDIIVAVNGKTINGNADLAGILLAEAPGTQVKVTVQRDSSQRTFTVTLGERPPSA